MYERFFGLDDTPFRLTPDPRYLFLSSKHAEALAHLRLGLKESSGFVCITGDVGTGKTTLLRVVLVGQPQLRTLLLDPAMAQLNQRITLRWHMGPLRYRETVAYVRHRLSIASEGRAARLFTVPALRLTHSLAGGVPRLINMI